MMHLVILLVVSLVAVPAALSAQAMPADVRRDVGGAGGLAISDGEPISFVLENSSLLDLREAQRISLMAIRRRLRAVNAQHVKQLDSLRELVGLTMEPRERGLSEEDRRKLQRFQALSLPITDSIRMNNDAAKIQARELLDSAQVVKLDSIALRERGGVAGRRGRPPSNH
jgi:hypothetical protein